MYEKNEFDFLKAELSKFVHFDCEVFKTILISYGMARKALGIYAEIIVL